MSHHDACSPPPCENRQHSNVAVDIRHSNEADENSAPLASNADDANIPNADGNRIQDDLKDSSIADVSNVLNTDDNGTPLDSNVEDSLVIDENGLPDTLNAEDSSTAQYSNVLNTDENGAPLASNADDANIPNADGNRMQDDLQDSSIAHVSNVLYTDDNGTPLDSNAEDSLVVDENGLPDTLNAEDSSTAQHSNVLNTDENGTSLDSNAENSSVADENDLPDISNVEDSSIADVSNVLNTDENGTPLDSNTEDSSVASENDVPDVLDAEDSSIAQYSNVLNTDENGTPFDSNAEYSRGVDAKTALHDSNAEDSCRVDDSNIPNVDEKNALLDSNAEGTRVPNESLEVTVDATAPHEDATQIRIPPAVEERLIHQLLFWRVKWELGQTRKPSKQKQGMAASALTKTTPVGDTTAAAATDGAKNELIAAHDEKTNAPARRSGATAEVGKEHDVDAGYVTAEIIRKAPNAAAVKELLEAKLKLLLREVVTGLRQVRKIRAHERKNASLQQGAVQKNGDINGTEVKDGLKLAGDDNGPQKDTPETLEEHSASSDDESKKDEDGSAEEDDDGDDDDTKEDEGDAEARTIAFADVLFYRVVLHLGRSQVLASRCCAEILKMHSSREIEELLGNPVLFMNKMKLILRSLGKVVDSPKDVHKKAPTGAPRQTSKHPSQPMLRSEKPKKQFQPDVITGANMRIFLALQASEQTRILHQEGNAEASNAIGRALLKMAIADPPLPVAQFTFILKIACREIVQPDETTALAIATAEKQLNQLKKLKGQANPQQGDGTRSDHMAGKNDQVAPPADSGNIRTKGKGKKGKGERETINTHGGDNPRSAHTNHDAPAQTRHGQDYSAQMDSRGPLEDSLFKVVTPIKQGRDVYTQVNPNDFTDQGVRSPQSKNATNKAWNLTATSPWPKITILQRPKNDDTHPAIAQSTNSPPLRPRNPYATTWESFVASKSASTNTTASAAPTQRTATSASQEVLPLEWPTMRPQQRATAPSVPSTDATAWPTLGTNGSPKKINGASSPAQRWSDRVRMGRLWADELVDEDMEHEVPQAVKKMDGALKSSSSTAAPTGPARQQTPQAGIRMVIIVEAPGDSITFKPDASFVGRRDALARICASSLYLHQKSYNPVCVELITIFEDGHCLRFGPDFVKSCPVPSERSIVEAMKNKSRQSQREFASFNNICRQYKTDNTYGLLLCSTHPDAIIDFSQPQKVDTPPSTQYTLLVLLGTVKDVEPTTVNQFQNALWNEKIPLVKASLGNVTEFTSKIIDVLHGYIGYNHLLPRVLAIAKLGGKKAGKRRPAKQKFRPPPLRAVLGSLGLQGAAASYHVVRAMVGQLWRSRGAYEENSITFVGEKVLTVQGTVVQNLNSQHKAAPCERNVLGFLKQVVYGNQGEFRVDEGVVGDEMPRGTMVVEVDPDNSDLPLLNCTSCAPAQADGAIIVVLHTKNARAPYAFNALPEGILICRVRLPHMSHHAALALLNLYNQNNVLWPSLVRHAKRKLEEE